MTSSVHQGPDTPRNRGPTKHTYDRAGDETKEWNTLRFLWHEVVDLGPCHAHMLSGCLHRLISRHPVKQQTCRPGDTNTVKGRKPSVNTGA